MKKTFLLILAIGLIFLGNKYPAFSNDTALSAMGDNVGPFQGTPDVILDHEIINLDISQNQTSVDVTFYLKSDGPTQTILVGFPDEAASYELPGQEELNFGNTIGTIKEFKTYINGAPVNSTVKYQIIKREYPDGTFKEFKEVWHTFPVNFKAGETVVIRNTYRVENGVNVLGEKNFHYTLKTGKKWKGPIGSTKIYANLKNGLTFNDIFKQNSTKGITYVSPSKAMWEFKNFEPDENQGTAYFYLTFKQSLALEARKRQLSEADIHGMSDWELKALRNEIYARHGRPFKSESLKGYFSCFDWYKINPNYSDNLLNALEKKNAQFILNYEKKIGSKIIYND